MVSAREQRDARVTLSHLEDRIDQNQSPDFLRTDRDTLDAQADWRLDPTHLLGFGTMVSMEGHAANPSARP